MWIRKAALFVFLQLQAVEAADLAIRRILILDFVNQKHDANTDFLIQSIPNAFMKPLEETKTFEILDPQKGRNLALAMSISTDSLYDIQVATRLGKRAEADIVIIGNFTVIQSKIHILAQAVDVSSQRVKVTDNQISVVNSELFGQVNALTNRMSAKMKAELPPLPEREIIRYQKTNELHVAAYGVYALPLSTPFSDIYQGAFGGYVQMDYSVFQFGKFYLAPAIGGSYLKYPNKTGVFPGIRLQTFAFLGGMDLGYALFRTFTVHLSGLAGVAISELQRDFDNVKIQSRDIELRMNLELRYIVWHNLSVSTLGSYSHILYTGSDLGSFQGLLGLGYGF